MTQDSEQDEKYERIKQIRDGLARALFVSWFANLIEGSYGPVKPEAKEKYHPQGGDWMDTAPETPIAVTLRADALLSKIIAANKSWADVIERPDVIEDPESFGHYLGMECLGHGVAWSDDHKPHELDSPRIEYCGEGCEDLMDEVSGFFSEEAKEQLWKAYHILSKYDVRINDYIEARVPEGLKVKLRDVLILLEEIIA